MPKRIIIRGGEITEEKEEPIIEQVKHEEKLPLEGVAEEIEVSGAHLELENRELEEAEIDAEMTFDAIKKKIEEIRLREKVTQQKFRDQPDMGIAILKKILQKWDEMREEVRRNISEAVEKYRRLRTLLEQRFSKLEEELYFNQIELDTLRQLEEQGEPVSLSKKEELEKLIPTLMNKLTETDKKIKEVDSKIEYLKKIADNIYESTAYKDVALKLFEEMASLLQERRGEDAVPVLRTQIDTIAQREGIPREYATIYVWRKLKKY
ncbi:MAG: hypothetical protein QXK95_00060 [Nitrososphaerota archaeon]